MIFPIRSERLILRSSGLGFPNATVRLACGSVSTRSTFFPAIASPTPRFSQVVVFPVPPFWFVTAVITPFLVVYSDVLSLISSGQLPILLQESSPFSNSLAATLAQLFLGLGALPKCDAANKASKWSLEHRLLGLFRKQKEVG